VSIVLELRQQLPGPEPAEQVDTPRSDAALTGLAFAFGVSELQKAQPTALHAQQRRSSTAGRRNHNGNEQSFH
jgi:hypothetical protein